MGHAAIFLITGSITSRYALCSVFVYLNDVGLQTSAGELTSKLFLRFPANDHGRLQIARGAKVRLPATALFTNRNLEPNPLHLTSHPHLTQWPARDQGRISYTTTLGTPLTTTTVKHNKPQSLTHYCDGTPTLSYAVMPDIPEFTFAYPV
jgi:hypothetical protein